MLHLRCKINVQKLATRTNVYKYSFYPKTIKHWNSLSSDMASVKSPVEFLKLHTTAN